MIDRCKFIQFCKNVPEEVATLLWTAFISNSRGIIEDEEIRNMCGPFLKQGLLNDLLEQRRGSSTPHSCKHIKNNGFKCPESGCGVSHPADFEYVHLIVDNNTYCRVERNKEDDEEVTVSISPISNFIILPKERMFMLETGDEYLKADIITKQQYQYPEFIFQPDAFNTRPKFKGSLKGRLDLQFKGTENELQDIKRILTTYNPPKKLATRVIGLHNISGSSWIFICNAGAINQAGKRADLVLLSDQNRMVCDLISDDPIQPTELSTIAALLFKFNAPTITAPIIGWCFACFCKPRIFHLNKAFPLLIVHGEPGCGKTSTFNNVVLPLFGLSGQPESIGASTQFTFMRELSSSNCIPKIYDEHKRTVLSKHQCELISEMIRSVYNNLSGSRGRPDQTQVDYPYTAPVAILGEQGVSEVAHKDRIIDVFMHIKSRKSKDEFMRNFDDLSSANLIGFGSSLLKWTLGLNDSYLEEVYSEQFNAVDKELRDRVRINTAFGRFGVRMAGLFCEKHGVTLPFQNELLQAVDQAQIDNLGIADNRKSVVDEIIEALARMADQEFQRITAYGNVQETLYYLNAHEDYYIKDDLLKLNISKIYPKFQKWAKDFWEGEVLSKDEFLRQLKHDSKGYYIKGGTVNTGEKYWNGHILNLTKMDHLDLGKWQEEDPLGNEW